MLHKIISDETPRNIVAVAQPHRKNSLGRSGHGERKKFTVTEKESAVELAEKIRSKIAENVPLAIDGEKFCAGQTALCRIINCMEPGLVQDISVGEKLSIVVDASNHAIIVYIEGNSGCRAWKIRRFKTAVPEDKAVGDAILVRIRTNNIAFLVDSIWQGSRRARKIKGSNDNAILICQKSVKDAGGILNLSNDSS